MSTLYGTVYLGATVAPLNTSYIIGKSHNIVRFDMFQISNDITGEMHHALNLSKPKIIFTSASSAHRIVECAKNNSFVKKIIHFDDTPAQNIQNNVTTFSTFVNNKQVRRSES